MLLPEEYQATTNCTWFNQNEKPVWEYEVVPYNLVAATGSDANGVPYPTGDGVAPLKKSYCTVDKWNVVIDP